MIILGIDPGKADTGWGVVKSTKQKRKTKLECVGYGVVKTEKELEDAQRLRLIFNKINSLIRKFEPEVAAVETLYFFKNRKTAMGVAQSRGVVLLSAARKELKVEGFTPLQAKMAITGYGRAKKSQVQKMVKKLLDMEEIPRPSHAADALAMAICYTRTNEHNKKINHKS